MSAAEVPICTNRPRSCQSRVEAAYRRWSGQILYTSDLAGCRGCAGICRFRIRELFRQAHDRKPDKS